MPDSDFKPTREEMIRAAFRRCGIQNPSTVQMAVGLFSFQLVIKDLDPEAKHIWTRSLTPHSLTTVAAQSSYATGATATTIPLYIQEIDKAFLYRSSQHEPLDVYELEEAQDTYLKDDTGEPVAVALEKFPNPADQKLWVYPTPNAAFTIKLLFQRKLYDADEAAGNPDFPGHWYRAVILCVAEVLGGDYGAPDLANIVAQADKARLRALTKSGPKKRPRRMKISDF